MNSLCEAVEIRSELASPVPNVSGSGSSQTTSTTDVKPANWFIHVMLVLSRQKKDCFVPLAPVSAHTSISEEDLMKFIVHAPKQGDAINYFMNENRVCVRVSAVVNAIYTHCFGNLLIDPQCSKLISYLLYMEGKAMHAILNKDSLPPNKRHRSDQQQLPPPPNVRAEEELRKAKKEVARLKRVTRETKKKASREKNAFVSDVLALIKNQRNKDTGEFSGRTDVFASQLHDLCTRNIVRTTL